jgi:hypothetical protein
MVKKMLFAVAILALAVAGPGAGLLEARPPVSELCYPGTPCTSNYNCGIVGGLPQGVCHNGSCICY